MAAAVLLIVALAGEGALSQGKDASVSVEAWSDTAGPYGLIWNLEILPDGSGTVFIGGPDKPNEERQFTLSAEARQTIIQAIDKAKFFELPNYLGPPTIPLHEPENVLQVELNGRIHKVRLHDPSKDRSPRAARFKDVWKALAAASPIKPPINP